MCKIVAYTWNYTRTSYNQQQECMYLIFHNNNFPIWLNIKEQNKLCVTKKNNNKISKVSEYHYFILVLLDWKFFYTIFCFCFIGVLFLYGYWCVKLTNNNMPAFLSIVSEIWYISQGYKRKPINTYYRHKAFSKFWLLIFTYTSIYWHTKTNKTCINMYIVYYYSHVIYPSRKRIIWKRLC